MFEKVGPEEWIAVILRVGAVLGYAFKVERNTSSTAKSNEMILNSLNSHKLENENDHQALDNKVEVVKSDVHKLDKRVTVLENVPQNPIGDCI